MRLRVLTACLMLTACFGADEEAPEEGAEPTSQGTIPPPDAPPVTAPPAAPTGASAKVAPTPMEASRFLVQASFGPTDEDIASIEAEGYEGWIAEQMSLPMAPYGARLDGIGNARRDDLTDLFWGNVVEADDQLRHRVAYALSKIVTVSLNGTNNDRPETFGAYMDILQGHAFGNYEDMIREVTMTPAMGLWLSHLGNRKADPEQGIEPDENYAREVMQLFTIGLVELNADGTEREAETYETADVQGLAAVFTGLSWADTDFRGPRVRDWNQALPMEGYGEFHESAPKTFLGATVDSGTDTEAGVQAGLDVVLSHPNLAPFVVKQLIQHLVSSNPTPGYVSRVVTAFEAGTFTGPEGTAFGRSRRGDMAATVAAILLDEEARDADMAARPEHGKLREPVLRFAHLVRAFRDDAGAPETGKMESSGAMRYASNLDVLAQEAYSPPSVFGWFRPGYVVPGGWTAGEDMVAPEMQLSTGSALAGYVTFMAQTVENKVWGTDFFDLDREPLYAIATDADALIAELELKLIPGGLTAPTRERIEDALKLAVIDERDTDRDRRYRTELALLMMVTAPEFAVQR